MAGVGEHCRGKGRGVTTLVISSRAIKWCDSRSLKISWPLQWREKIRGNSSLPSSSSSYSFFSFLFPARFWREARTCSNAAASQRIRRKCEPPPPHPLPPFSCPATDDFSRASRATFGSFFPTHTLHEDKNFFSIFLSSLPLNKHEVNHRPCCHLHLCLSP